ncbi:MSCRAMM family protein [Marmoricola sp. RAF53]|uniref:MSCRAMM family protein n=1 Tax=Marmoricola sp. RAF53 TaxID=3233059 RepID=UPI003F9CE6EA
MNTLLPARKSGHLTGRSRRTARRIVLGALVLGLAVLGIQVPAFAANGTVSGTLTGSDGGVVLVGAVATAYQYDAVDDYFYYYDDAQTNASGGYALSVPPGQYKLCFDDADGFYARECYDNKPDRQSADAFTVASAGSVVRNAELTRNGAITGTVTGADGGTALPGVLVTAYLPDADGDGSPEWAMDASTEVDGTYRLDLAPGTYRVCFEQASNAHRPECYNDKATVDLANPVTVTGSATTPNINAVLAANGSISGTVTAVTGGAALENVDVSLLRYNATDAYWEDFSYASTDASGAYRVYAAPGQYRVCFDSSTYARECYNNAASVQTAQDVTITGTAITSGINASLVAKGKITGTVTAAVGGAPLSDIDVAAYAWDAGSSSWDYVDGSNVDAGTYEVLIPAGTYKVCFSDYGAGDYAFECYNNNARTVAAGANVVVAAGATTSNINAALDIGGKITGTVNLQPGMDDYQDYKIRVVDKASGDTVWTQDGIGDTAAYEVKGLLAGSYRVEFGRSSGTATAAAQFYNNVPEQQGTGAASNVNVTLGGTAAGVNATMQTGGKIVGKLVDGNGAGLECRIQAFTQDGSLVTRSNWTNPDGTFAITGLTTGSYLVTVPGQTGGLDEQCTSGARFATGVGGGTMASSAAGAVAVQTTLGATTTLGSNLVYGAPVANPTVQNTALPTISGTPRVGTPLTATNGSWNPATGLTYGYVWKAGGSTVGTNASTYTPVAGDLGKTVTVTVTASKAGYDAGTATSAQTAAVAAAPAAVVANVARPTILGSAVVGNLLTATTPTWNPADATTTYQWLANGVPIPGAVGPAYAVGAGVVGKAISVQVTGAKAGLSPGSAVSVPTGIVKVYSAATLSSVKKLRTVKFVLAVRASGVATVGGRVQVIRNGKVLRTVSLVGGKASVLLRRQPKGRQVFVLKYLGSGPVIGTSVRRVIKF